MPGDNTLAAARWSRLVADRLEEMQRLSPGPGSVSGPHWGNGRADRYAARMRERDTESDPFLRRLRTATHASSRVIDVGAGTGRFALSLASSVGHVTAVDPSEAMLTVLQRDSVQRGVANVTTVQARWEDTEIPIADVAFSAFALTLVRDARPFLVKLDAAARDHAFLYLGAFCTDAVLDPLWRHFHGTPRVPGPSYLDAVAVLRELGIAPEVKVVEVPNRRRFATIGEAVEEYRDGLMAPDTPAARRDLEALLAEWLLGRRGAYRSPMPTVPAAIVHWRPRPRP